MPRFRFGAILLGSLSAVGALLAVSISINVPRAALNGTLAFIIIAVGLVIFATLKRTLRRQRHSHSRGRVALENFAGIKTKGPPSIGRA